MKTILKYKAVFKSEKTIVDDEKLRDFVISRIKQFGGHFLLSTIYEVICSKNSVEIAINDKKRKFDVHASLFLCGKVGNMECCFVSE